MAQLPKGGLVRGHDKPIHGSCAIYFPGGIDYGLTFTLNIGHWKKNNVSKPVSFARTNHVWEGPRPRRTRLLKNIKIKNLYQNGSFPKWWGDLVIWGFSEAFVLKKRVDRLDLYETNITSVRSATPPKISIEPENDDFRFPGVYFQVPCQSSHGTGIFTCMNFWFWRNS